MLTRRIIPCLDVKDGRIVKGINFVDLRDAGDPVEAAIAYQAAGADEIVFLDIAATLQGRETMLGLVNRIAEDIFIPFTVGGGITSNDDIRRVLAAGADKVGINSAAVKDPSFVTRAAREFGSQCIVCAVDVRRVSANDAETPKWEVFVAGGTKATGLDAIEWCIDLVRRGAGEILLTSMDRDGTKDGYDLKLLQIVTQAVDVPVVASGGAGTLEHLADGLEAGAHAVLAASIFHFGEITIPQARAFLAERGYPMRPFDPQRDEVARVLEEAKK